MIQRNPQNKNDNVRLLHMMISHYQCGNVKKKTETYPFINSMILLKVYKVALKNFFYSKKRKNKTLSGFFGF